ncbi:MAG: exodeoxyribonuclease VII large subunit [Lachnospiraceae bacterium]|nr:exodeoxyribonuclease VII large subunit [Lachnospiraceae bacterium]
MRVYTVSQINGYIKNMFVKDMLLGRVSIKGEVSNCKYHTSGHIYFTLKDGTGQLPCVMFAGQRAGLDFRMSEGQSVIASGSVQVYERDGKYQLYANHIELDGTGQLYEQVERLKQKLHAEGLFDPAHKKPIPPYPKTIGIVTASTGAALQDIRNIAARRNPYIQLVLCPAQVQGLGAAESVARGIRRLDRHGVDLIIVARGGGSIEDLWAFNEELVARTVYECRTPVISGVGHETDTTVIDYVADMRAPTPSAAAELAVYEWAGLAGQLAGCHVELTRRMLAVIEAARETVDGRKKQLSYLSPGYRLAQKREQAGRAQERLSRQLRAVLDRTRRRTAQAEEALPKRMRTVLERKRQRMALAAERLKGISPLERLSQGYSYVAAGDGRTLTSVRQVKEGDELTISVRDGRIAAKVTGRTEHGGAGAGGE